MAAHATLPCIRGITCVLLLSETGWMGLPCLLGTPIFWCL